MSRWCSLLLILHIALVVSGQTEPFYVYGEIWDIDDKMIVPNGKVRAVSVDDTTMVFDGQMDLKGRYDLALPYDEQFRVEFSAPGYVTRFVVFDLRGLPQKLRNGDHGMNVQAMLLQPVPKVDYSVMQRRAFAVCKLNERGRGFDWDYDFAEKIKPELEALLDKHTVARKAAVMD